MHVPCSVISTIARDPDFRIQTALFYVRSSTWPQKNQLSSLSSSEADLKESNLDSDKTIPEISKLAPGFDICYEKADLGLLHLHRDRLAAAADALGWGMLDCLDNADSSLQVIRDALSDHIRGLTPLQEGILESRKVKILVDRTGTLSISSICIGTETYSQASKCVLQYWMPDSFDDLANSNDAPCKVFLDLQPTRPSTLTTHKTTHRCAYNSARERLGLLPDVGPKVQEVLLYNPWGEITETSSCTVYFRRNNTWTTPAAISGGTIGVSRRLAIEKGLCKQGIVEVEELRTGEQIWLSNGVRGFFRGILTTDALTLKQISQSEAIKLAKLGAGTGSDAGYGRALKNV